MLLRLAPSGGKWAVAARYSLDTEHHNQFESIELISLGDAAREDLVVESDAGAGSGDRFGSYMHILNLASGRFEELLTVPTRMRVMSQAETWTQTLDIPATRAKRGEAFCFVKTVYAAEHLWFPAPKVSRPCYPLGYGVEPR